MTTNAGSIAGNTATDREVIVGIDLGTTNSLVAWCDESGPRVLGEGGSALVPSVVRFSEDGRTVEAVGDDARSRSVEFPGRTVSSVKRLMGRSAQDAAGDLAFLPYRVVEGEHDTARVAIGDRLVTPQEVSARILGSLRDRASAALGVAVRKAVVTVPAYFDDAQRQATRDAGRLAGLEVVRIINEPTAASLAYGVGARATHEETIAVFDLGGGTFDVSILTVTPSGEGTPSRDGPGADYFEVLATAGDTRLGGDDVDHAIVSLILGEAGERFGIDLSADGALPPSTRQALKLFAEATKIRLSSEESAPMRIDLGDGRVYERALERAEFEALIEPWIGRAMARCADAVRDAGRSVDEIDRVVMVGGSTRIPLVRERARAFFGVEPYVALDPDTVVALGAAAQGAVLAGLDQSTLLLDVLPLSLGVETMGGGFAKLIVRNQSTPARAVETFTTSVDGQTKIAINVLQGEREMASDCRRLGEFTLSVPPMPAGMPRLEVEFLVDANGVLNVSAVEGRSGKRAAIQVVPTHGLSREEVDRLERESFEHAREDMTRHRIADLIVNGRLDIKWTRLAVERVGDGIEGGYRAEIESAMARLGDLLDRAAQDWSSVEADEVSAARDALNRTSMRLHEVSITRSLRNN
jgi:molecular chaperone DnaK (HSP70)